MYGKLKAAEPWHRYRLSIPVDLKVLAEELGLEVVTFPFQGRIKVVVLVSSANTKEAHDALDQFIDPLGASSIEAVVDADNTWNGKVDDGRLVSIDSVGHRKLWGGHYVGADFHLRFAKTVTG